MNCRAIPSAENHNSYNGHYMTVGRNAERVVMEWLKNRPSIVGIDDLRNLRAMQEADVDMSIRLYDGRVALAEIKSDWWLGVSGKIIFEILRLNHTCTTDSSCVLGWSARSPAKWLLFYAPQVKAIYKISFDDYRSAMQRFTQEEEPHKHIVTVRTDRIKTTLNLLIPEKYMAEGLKIYRIRSNNT